MRPQSETTFGRRLAAIRKDRGLSQAELATAVAKTRAAVGHWESGRAFIRGSDLARVARALGCRMRDLLAPVEAPIPPRPPWWPRWRTSKRQGRPACVNWFVNEPAETRSTPTFPTSAKTAELEHLRALLLEVLQRLVRYEPDALGLLDRITAPTGSVSDGRRAA